MKLLYLVVVILAVIAAYCIWLNNSGGPNPILEHMGGYGTLSGLYYNNNGRRSFRNIYDPPWFSGYSEVIGTITR